MWDLFSGGGGEAMMPEIIAAKAVEAGVPPPPLPGTSGSVWPDANAFGFGGSGNVGSGFDLFSPQASALAVQPQAVATGPNATPLATPTEASSTNNPAGAPLDIRPPAQIATEAAKAATKDTMVNKLLATLKGVQPPQTSQIQRVGTPAAPKMTAVQGGQLMALLQALGSAGVSTDGLKLPSTLGQAIGGKG